MKTNNEHVKREVRLIENEVLEYGNILERRFRLEGRTKFSLSNAFKNAMPQLMNGLTVIKFISPQDESFEKIKKLQNNIQLLLNKAELKDCIYFLPEESWHVTIYDLDWEEGVQTSTKNKFAKLYVKRLEEINTVFKKLGKPGVVKARIEGIGVSGAGCIVAKVHFVQKGDLNRILHIRSLIETGTGIQLSDFAAHISLGYLHRQLSDDELKEFFNVMRVVKDVDCGLLDIDIISFVLYNKLTKFYPVLSKNLKEGTIAQSHFDIKFITDEKIANI